ncbi:hypothetical protein C1H46_026884 [Malus baccata]|uniref:Uncharacterized protein n=1 Tax=Malus baccata TaxID=106549 RepID=A0A540LM68_MALBA|nr:hypothetical protein C1H46_026884 [Malus baccata]
MNPPSFVLEPSLRSPKLIPQRPMALSPTSYHTATSSSHSSVVATKMTIIYATKEKDKDAEGFGSGTRTKNAFVEDAIVVGSPVGSDDSSQSKEL